ncbi:transporter, putative [Hepatocystis sp. ex Piliocolobus tephrosceles]|nr:transporter, putative [Hepatocystis sp. ex Piliocolobus tephrosceles]
MVSSIKDEKKKSMLKRLLLLDIDVRRFSIIQKYVLFGIFCLYVTTCVGVFFNWIALSDFFYRSNIYLEYCNEQNKISNKTYKCEEQNKRVQTIYPIILCFNFIMTAISGLLFDYCGPKITGIISHSFNILAWILIGLQKGKSNIIIFGSVFLGLSSESAFIATISMIYIFPSNHTTYTIILGCCASFSFAIPFILELIAKGLDPSYFKTICFMYCIIILIPFFFILLFFLPKNNLENIINDGTEQPTRNNNTLTELEGYLVHNGNIIKSKNLKTLKYSTEESSTYSDRNSVVYNYTPHDENSKQLHSIKNLNTTMNELNIRKDFKQQINLSKHTPLESRDNKNELNKKNTSQQLIIDKVFNSSISNSSVHLNNINMLNISTSSFNKIVLHKQCENTLENKYILSSDDHILNDNDEGKKKKKKNCFNNNINVFSNSEQNNNNNNMPLARGKQKNIFTKIIGLFKIIKELFFTLKYMSVCYFFTIYNLSLVNYNSCANLFFGDFNGIEYLLKIFGPLSFISCVLFGFLIRKFHILIIIFNLLFISIMMYIFAILKNKIFAILSSFCFLIVTGCYTTPMYCYIQIMFPKSHFGKVAGTTSMISGLLSLIHIPIYNKYIVVYSNQNPNNFAYIVVALLFSAFPMLFIVYRQDIKKNKNIN